MEEAFSLLKASSFFEAHGTLFGPSIDDESDQSIEADAVHHSIIVEFGKEITSHRAQEAAQRIQVQIPEQLAVAPQ